MPTVRTSALAQQLTVAQGGGRLRYLHALNTNAAARWIQVFDLDRPVAATVAGVAEVSEIDFTGLDSTDVAGTYFYLYGAEGKLIVWFNTDDANVEPDVDGRKAEVALDGDDNDADIATKTGVVLAAYNNEEFANAEATGAVLAITDGALGARQNINAGDSGAAVAVTTEGVDAVPNPILSMLCSIPIAIGASINLPLDLEFRNGLVIANSTTAATYTAGAADSWISATV